MNYPTPESIDLHVRVLEREVEMACKCEVLYSEKCIAYAFYDACIKGR